MVANIHEERFKRRMSNPQRQGTRPPRHNEQSDGDAPFAASRTDGEITGLQVVSEMVDRILSGINFEVRNVDMWLYLPLDGEQATKGGQSPKPFGLALGAHSRSSASKPRLNLKIGTANYADDPYTLWTYPSLKTLSLIQNCQWKQSIGPLNSKLCTGAGSNARCATALLPNF